MFPLLSHRVSTNTKQPQPHQPQSKFKSLNLEMTMLRLLVDHKFDQTWVFSNLWEFDQDWSNPTLVDKTLESKGFLWSIISSHSRLMIAWYLVINTIMSNHEWPDLWRMGHRSHLEPFNPQFEELELFFCIDSLFCEKSACKGRKGEIRAWGLALGV